jgi:hypothetical protein
MAHLKTYDDGTIALVDIWTLEDIFSIAEDSDLIINNEIAIKTMQIMADRHDAEIGINWFTLHSALETAIEICNREAETVIDLPKN